MTSSTQINKALRAAVWNTYFDRHAGCALCWCGCGREIDMMDFECGHVIAASLGGPTTLENLRPICGVCNKSMGTRHLYEFMLTCGFAHESLTGESDPKCLGALHVLIYKNSNSVEQDARELAGFFDLCYAYLRKKNIPNEYQVIFSTLDSSKAYYTYLDIYNVFIKFRHLKFMRNLSRYRTYYHWSYPLAPIKPTDKVFVLSANNITKNNLIVDYTYSPSLLDSPNTSASSGIPTMGDSSPSFTGIGVGKFPSATSATSNPSLSSFFNLFKSFSPFKRE